MAQFFEGYKRLTHCYTNGWAHEDKHQYVGQFRVLSARRMAGDPDSYDGRATTTYRVKAPAGASEGDVKSVLQTTFARGCRCEHDCCGHIFSYTGRIRRVRRREWLVDVHSARNV